MSGISLSHVIAFSVVPSSLSLSHTHTLSPFPSLLVPLAIVIYLSHIRHVPTSNQLPLLFLLFFTLTPQGGRIRVIKDGRELVLFDPNDEAKKAGYDFRKLPFPVQYVQGIAQLKESKAAAAVAAANQVGVHVA